MSAIATCYQRDRVKYLDNSLTVSLYKKIILVLYSSSYLHMLYKLLNSYCEDLFATTNSYSFVWLLQVRTAFSSQILHILTEELSKSPIPLSSQWWQLLRSRNPRIKIYFNVECHTMHRLLAVYCTVEEYRLHTCDELPPAEEEFEGATIQTIAILMFTLKQYNNTQQKQPTYASIHRHDVNTSSMVSSDFMTGNCISKLMP